MKFSMTICTQNITFFKFGLQCLYRSGLNHTINCKELKFVTEYSMLRQKLCDAATDALRLKRLEANNYSTVALELIDPEETPKNILLRAIKKPNTPANLKKADAARQEYESARKFLLGLE